MDEKQTTPATATQEPQEATQAEVASGPEPKPKKRQKRAQAPKASKRAEGVPVDSASITLADLAAAYIASIESAGASTATVAGYAAELKRALSILGGNTLLRDLSKESVRKWMRCKAVTTKRDGTKRDQKTIDRTRRVLRLALVWAEERGIIEKAPVPEKI